MIFLVPNTDSKKVISATADLYGITKTNIGHYTSGCWICYL